MVSSSLGINKTFGVHSWNEELISSLSASQGYLGSGEDGSKKMDNPELDHFRELLPILETLCEDEGRKISFEEKTGKKIRKKALFQIKIGKKSLFYPKK